MYVAPFIQRACVHALPFRRPPPPSCFPASRLINLKTKCGTGVGMLAWRVPRARGGGVLGAPCQTK